MINVECKGEKLVKKKRYIIQTVVLGIVAWIFPNCRTHWKTAELCCTATKRGALDLYSCSCYVGMGFVSEQ